MHVLSIDDVVSVSGRGAAADGAQIGGAFGSAGALSIEMAAGASVSTALNSAAVGGIVFAGLGAAWGAGWEIGTAINDAYGAEIGQAVDWVVETVTEPYYDDILYDPDYWQGTYYHY